MAGHHEHHHTEQKPVAFTVPLILGSVAVFIIFLFVSLCDPRPHGHAAGGHNSHDSHQKDDGHRNATDKENIKGLGNSEGPDAVPAAESSGATNTDN